MEENKFRYFKLFLIDDDNDSKIFTTIEIIINQYT